MDKEKIELAFKCVDSLAAGLDPISGKLLPKDSAINQGDVVRALFYARSIIGQYRTKSAQPQQPIVQVLPVRAKDPTSSQNPDVLTPTLAPVTLVSSSTAPPAKPHERTLTPKEPHPQIVLDADNPENTVETPTGKAVDVKIYSGLKYTGDKKIKEFWTVISALGDPALKNIGYADVTAWLCEQGYMTKASISRQSKRPTEKGLTIGIYERQSAKGNGKFAAEVLYSPKAQAFIVEHLPDICKHHEISKVAKS